MNNPASGPQISVETRFMQNYRVAAPVDGGSDIAAVANGNGQVEVFTLGSGGAVWNFYPDPSSASGYNGVSMGITAEAIAAATDGGRIVLFAASGSKLTYAYEVNEPSGRWSTAEVQVPCNTHSNSPPKIVRIKTQNTSSGGLDVGIVFEVSPTQGRREYSFALSIWSAPGPTFYGGDAAFHSSPYWVWMEDDRTSFKSSFGCFTNQGLFQCGLWSHEGHRDKVTGELTPIDIDSAKDSKGNDLVFAVLTDGNLYQLKGSAAASFSWFPLTEKMDFRQVRVVRNAAGQVGIFAVATNNRLYYWEPKPGSATGYADPSPIHANVAGIGVAANDAGQIDLFAVGTSHSSLTHLFQQQVRTNWVAETVETPKDGAVEEYIAYSTDVTLYDAAGAPLVNTAVNIWSDEECRITVNGATYFAVPNRPARMSTNAAGILAIGQETGGLGIPALQLNIPSLMPADQSLVVEQSAAVQEYLGRVKSGDLMEARDAAGAFLIPDSHRNTGDTEQLANAFNACMALAENPAPPPAAMLRRHGQRPGVWVRNADSRRLPGRIADPPPDQHWEISFAESGIVFRTLSAAEAQAIIAGKQALAAETRELGGSWWSDIGDFLAGVVDGFINVVNTVVSTAGNVLKAVFTFIIDGVKKVFDAAIRWIGDAFDLVEVIFAQIAVPFEKLFEWLGEVFNWKHILFTHEALAYAMTQMVDFLDGAITGIKGRVDAGIADLQGRVPVAFDQAIKNLQGSVGGYAEKNRPSDRRYSAALSNNIVYNGLIDNAGAARFDFAGMRAMDTGPYERFLEKATTFLDATEATKAFTDAQTYFSNLGSSPDEIFTQLLSGLLKLAEALVLVALEGVQAVVDALLDAAATMVGALRTMLTQTWEVPFLSPFYSWLTNGEPLTVLNLVTLMVASPATVLYKMVFLTTSAPFPNKASVAAFRNSFNAKALLAAAGFGGEAVREGAVTAVSEAAAGLLFLASGISTFGYGMLTALIDACPPPPFVPQPEGGFLTSALILEFAWQVFCCPWYIAEKPFDYRCDTEDGANTWLWTYQWISFFWDWWSVVRDDSMPEADDLGAKLFCVYGVFHALFGINASVLSSASPLDWAGNLVPAVPEMAKILRSAKVIARTGGRSLLALAAFDGFFYVASAGITLVQAGEHGPHPPGAAVAMA